MVPQTRTSIQELRLFPEASDGMCEDLPATCSPAAAWIPSKFVLPRFAR